MRDGFFRPLQFHGKGVRASAAPAPARRVPFLTIPPLSVPNDRGANKTPDNERRGWGDFFCPPTLVRLNLPCEWGVLLCVCSEVDELDAPLQPQLALRHFASLCVSSLCIFVLTHLSLSFSSSSPPFQVRRLPLLSHSLRPPQEPVVHVPLPLSSREGPRSPSSLRHAPLHRQADAD